MPRPRKDKPLPGSSKKYLDEHNERLGDLLGVKSRKSEGFKKHVHRVKSMRPGSRHPNRNKKAMWNKLAEELDIPEDDAPLQGQAYSEDYQDKEKKNKSGTKADEATDPDAKEDIAKEAFWVGVVKMARANGLSTAETLGLCTQIDGGRIESENDPYIYGAMLKDAEDDLSDIDDLKRMHDVQAEEEQQGKEILGDQEIQTSTEGSPLQNSKMKEETELAEIHNDQDIQYEGTKDSFPEEGEVPEVLGDHPPKNHGLGKGDSLKEAAFQAGFDEVMRDLQ